MEEEKEAAVVTEDRWMREEGGQLDETDRAILREASQNGKMNVRVINIKELLETLKGTEPKKYQGIKKTMEGHAGKRLTFDELVEFGRKADERMKEFVALVSPDDAGAGGSSTPLASRGT